MVEPLFQPVKVEVILDELLIDFAEEIVVFEVAEPLNPASFGVLRVVILNPSLDIPKGNYLPLIVSPGSSNLKENN